MRTSRKPREEIRAASGSGKKEHTSGRPGRVAAILGRRALASLLALMLVAASALPSVALASASSEYGGGSSVAAGSAESLGQVGSSTSRLFDIVSSRLTEARIPAMAKSDLPEESASLIERYIENGWKGTPKGLGDKVKTCGKKWDNDKHQLPWISQDGKAITYREWDARLPLVDESTGKLLRVAERFLSGSDGKLYYTPDHYTTTFIRIIDVACPVG